MIRIVPLFLFTLIRASTEDTVTSSLSPLAQVSTSSSSSSSTGSSSLKVDNYEDVSDVRIDRMYEDDLDRIWTNIEHQEAILCRDSKPQEAQLPFKLINATQILHPVSAQVLASIRSTPNLRYSSSVGGSNIKMMENIFHDILLHQRNDDFDAELKAKTREGIVERLSHYTLETQSQEFYARASNGSVIRGVNIIGVIPGRNRGKAGDQIVLVGAHYDTVQGSPGVDDNGSGVVALLEIARLLSPRMGHFNNTVMLVAFDLEEKGILGSLAFVNNYLIPNELIGRQAKFQGAYILDMVMNYDPHPRSQVMPLDILAGVPESALWLRRNFNSGNFVSVWTRRVIDWPLWHNFQMAWDKNAAASGVGKNSSETHKVLMLDPPIPRNPLLLSQLRFRAFYRSDHASFWAHRHHAYRESLSAVLLTDMGAWRGKQRGCYHEFCDDARFLTAENMDFLKKVTDAVASAVARLAE